MTTSTKLVLAGVDGSEQSLAAASWAATEAALSHARLHVLVVNDDPARDDYASATARRGAQHCNWRYPDLAVTHEVVRGHPAEVLVDRSRQAQQLVVGSRGHGRFAATLLGSISAAVAYHAHCPVVVVRDHHGPGARAPVVVGVDDSLASRLALQFAFDAATVRHTELIAVHAWREPAVDYPMLIPDAIAAPLTDLDRIEEVVRGNLAQHLDGWREKYPDVTVHPMARRGHPVRVLADTATDADGQLLVVGHRGRGGFAGLRLGSVAAGVLHHVHGPVAVVRATDDHDRA
ncbi:universal stress protein [Gandjariella thermophila]|uniref:Universal stress protein n=1 Tax=Gandjariella thermophila TaxID=1931992 RepID=A0A4D4JHE1_9PSEU|nr:universal stress protein [Gandjariella thermophila]GDY33806.1 universal stress protein [Gandjariella thermophila]